MESNNMIINIKECYGIRICSHCKELFLIDTGIQRYAIQKEEAYHRIILCKRCWKIEQGYV